MRERIKNGRCSVYVLAGHGGLHKIGVAHAPTHRLGAISRDEEAALSCVATFERPSRNDATRIESAVHRAMKPHHVRGEWFAVTAAEAIAAISAAIFDADRLGEPVSVTWTIPSAPVRTRQAAVKAAHRENLTVAQWLERRVDEWQTENAAPRDSADVAAA